MVIIPKRNCHGSYGYIIGSSTYPKPKPVLQAAIEARKTAEAVWAGFENSDSTTCGCVLTYPKDPRTQIDILWP